MKWLLTKKAAEYAYGALIVLGCAAVLESNWWVVVGCGLGLGTFQLWGQEITPPP